MRVRRLLERVKMYIIFQTYNLTQNYCDAQETGRREEV